MAARDGLLEATVDTAAIALLRLIDCGGSGLSCALQRIVAAIVADNDYLVYQRMRPEISNCIRDAGLIVIGGERHNQTSVGDRVAPDLQLRRTFMLKQQEQ